jgi:hypothetical protein
MGQEAEAAGPDGDRSEGLGRAQKGLTTTSTTMAANSSTDTSL